MSDSFEVCDDNPSPDYSVETKLVNAEQLRDYLETLYAIELLEYHGKGYLALDDEKRNEEKRAILERALAITGKSSKEHT